MKIRRKSSDGFTNRQRALLDRLPAAILCGLRRFVNRSGHACVARMAADGLIDTGAMLALPDPSDQFGRQQRM
jgi:hypothetical protein